MKKHVLAVAAAAALVAGPAFAQSVEATDVTPNDMLAPAQRDVAVTVDAGVGTFLGQLSDFTGAGPTWGVSANGYATRGLGWEVGYSGARIPLTDDRVGDGAATWRNGVDAMAKVYAPVNMALRPFAGVGIGASYWNVNDDGEGLYTNDWVAELPVAAGLELMTNNGLTAGIRADYRFMAGEEFAKNAFVGESPEGGLLSGQLMVGGTF